MVSLTDLPDEVLALIVEESLTGTQFSLTLTNRRLHNIANPRLYQEDIEDEHGSAAFWAARHGRLDTLERLRSYGAEWNNSNASRSFDVYTWAFPEREEPDEFGTDMHDTFFHPLHIAAKFGQISVVRWLLDQGARLEVPSQNLCSCQPGLEFAVEAIEPEDRRDSPFFTPVHTAVCHGHLDITQLLLQRGASERGSIWSRFAGDMTCLLHTAARKNDGDMIRLLQKVPGDDKNKGWVDVNTADSDGYTAMHLAVMHRGELHALKALDPSAIHGSSLDGSTPLSLAFQYGFFHACSHLNEALGRESRRPELRRGEVPEHEHARIHRAVRPIESFFQPAGPAERDAWERQRAEFVDSILKTNFYCDVNGSDLDGRNPLDASIVQGAVSPHLVRCLLENGANANHKDDHQHTALLKVCDFDDLELFKACAEPLLRHGARLDAPGPFHMSALETALAKAHDGVHQDCSAVEFLLKHANATNIGVGYLNSVLFSLLSRGWYAECRVLMRHGAKLDMVKEGAQKLLKDSIRNKNLLEMSFCLDKLSDMVSAKFALYLALEMFVLHDNMGGPLNDDQDQVVRLLFSRSDLKLYRQNHGATTSLHLACSELAPMYIVEKLVEKGADVNVFDEHFRTPLTMAVERGCPHIVELLIKHGANPHIQVTNDEWYYYRERYSRKLHALKHGKRPPKAHQIKYVKASYLYRPDVATEEYQTPFETAVRLFKGDGVTFRCHNHDNSSSDEDSGMVFFRLMALLPLKPSKLVRAAMQAPKALRIVLDNGADPNGGEHSDKPPLMLVLRNLSKTDVKSVARAMENIGILLNAGARIERKNEDSVCFADVMREANKACAKVTNENAEFEADCTDLFFVQCWLVRHFRLSLTLCHGWRVHIVAETSAEEMVAEFMRRRDAFLGPCLQQMPDPYVSELLKEIMEKEAAKEEKNRARQALALADRGGTTRRSERLRERNEGRKAKQDEL